MSIGKSSKCEQFIQFSFILQKRSCIMSWTWVSGGGLDKLESCYMLKSLTNELHLPGAIWAQYHQQSGSWIQDQDDGEDDQVLQPKIKRKRSIRLHPRHTADRSEEKYGKNLSIHCQDASQLPFQMDHRCDSQARDDSSQKVHGKSSLLKHDKTDSSFKNRRNLPSRKLLSSAQMQVSVKSGRGNRVSSPSIDDGEYQRENWDSKVMKGAKGGGSKMSEVIQRKVSSCRPFLFCCIHFGLWICEWRLVSLVLCWDFLIASIFWLWIEESIWGCLFLSIWSV